MEYLQEWNELTRSHPVRQTASKRAPCYYSAAHVVHWRYKLEQKSKVDNRALLLAGEDVCTHSQCYNYCDLYVRLPKKQNRASTTFTLLLAPTKVPCKELAEGFIHNLIQLEEGVVMYDAHLKTNVLVRAPVILIIGDNPRHSEILSHMGSIANKFWRMCMVSVD